MMKKCWKQVLLLVMVTVAVICIGRTETKAATSVEKGSCGDKATYTLDSDGLLTISGSGEIKDEAFYERKDIKKVVIQKNITEIGKYSFFNCYRITSITMADSVKNIGKSAFAYCDKVTNIVIPDSVTNIGENTFLGCRGLKNVTISNNVTSIDDEVFAECVSLINIVIPDKVTSIGVEAFAGCSNLTKITIPDGMDNIGRWAFEGCSSLKSITIPNSVTSIGGYAFEECSSLRNITISDGVTNIGKSAFINCRSLKSITIPSSVTLIGAKAIGYKYDDEENKIKIDNFTIYGTKGSAAETYAKENGFIFKTSKNKEMTVKLSKTAFNFDGKAKKPTVKVLDTKGRTLKKSNYTVTYSNNVKVGKATATITFKGKYSGTIKKTFTIKPAKTTITGISRKSDSVTLTWKKQKKEASGYQIQYATDRKFTKSAKTITAKGIKKSSKKISGLSKKTTYYFRIRTYKTVNGKKYYSGWSKIETVKTK